MVDGEPLWAVVRTGEQWLSPGGAVLCPTLEKGLACGGRAGSGGNPEPWGGCRTGRVCRATGVWRPVVADADVEYRQQGATGFPVPVPQVRGEIREYLPLGFTGNWLSFKGHIAYGRFTDNGWQEAFVAPGQYYAQDVYYHSKSLMFRLGNRERFPLTFEFGLLMATQFAGDQLVMQNDGTGKLVTDMPGGLKAFWKAFMPQAGGSDTRPGEQVNVEGNMLGSWNFALTYELGDWRLRAYLEHYFEDHSQMFWEYGRWKDGQLGLEMTLPRNRWVSKVLWEGLATKDQAGPILYDGFWGNFQDMGVIIIIIIISTRLGSMPVWRWAIPC